MICSNFRGRISIPDAINLPLSIINELYIIAWERVEADMKAEEERKKDEEHNRNKDPRGTRLNGYIGNRRQLMTNLEDLVDIIEEGG